MHTILQVVDAFLCVLVVIAAAEYLRRIRPTDDPILAIVLYVVAIAGFGSFLFNIKGHAASPFTMALHGAIVLYAFHRRGHICKTPQ
jgi:hypothetical protein